MQEKYSIFQFYLYTGCLYFAALLVRDETF